MHNSQCTIHNSQFIKRKDEYEIDTRSTLVASSLKNYRNDRNDYSTQVSRVKERMKEVLEVSSDLRSGG